MFTGFIGYSQSGKEKGSTNVITFPNGDEAITIIEKSDTNVLKLTSNESYTNFQTLELSNHEAFHNLSLKRNIKIVDKSQDRESGLTMNQNERPVQWREPLHRFGPRR